MPLSTPTSSEWGGTFALREVLDVQWVLPLWSWPGLGACHRGSPCSLASLAGFQNSFRSICLFYCSCQSCYPCFMSEETKAQRIMTRPILRALRLLSHLILTTQWGWCCQHPHFKDKITGPGCQRWGISPSLQTCSQKHSLPALTKASRVTCLGAAQLGHGGAGSPAGSSWFCSSDLWQDATQCQKPLISILHLLFIQNCSWFLCLMGCSFLRPTFGSSGGPDFWKRAQIPETKNIRAGRALDLLVQPSLPFIFGGERETKGQRQ